MRRFDSYRGYPIERLRAVERHLVAAVLATTTLALVLPAIGEVLSRAVTSLLALLMFCVSLTFDLDALRGVLRRPGVQALATGSSTAR